MCLQLREALTIIPQNVLLFKDTLEYNLDPMGTHRRERMLQVIDKLGIRRWNELQAQPGFTWKLHEIIFERMQNKRDPYCSF